LPVVTVFGGNQVVIAIPFTSDDNAAAATALLQTLYYSDATHIVDASSGLSQDGSIPGDVNSFTDDVGGQIAVPLGYQYLIGAYSNAAPSNPVTPINAFVGEGDFDNAIIDSGNSSLAYTAGSGIVTIVAGGNFTMTTQTSGGGSGTLLLDGGGTELLTLSTGSWSITTGTGPGVITLGLGNDTVNVEGTDTIVGGSGSAVVVMDHGQDVYNGGNGTATIVDAGNLDSVTGGAGRETVFAQTTGLRVQGGGGEVLFIDSVTGGNTLIAGSGGAVVFGGPTGSTYTTGGSYFFLTSGGGSDTINAASGSVGPIVFGSPDGRVAIDGGAAGGFVVAGAGSETVDASGSSQGLTFFAGTGDSDLIGGAGSNFFAASTGFTTMSGGLGNIYEFINGHAGATNVITDFNSYDGLYLANFGLGSGDGIQSEIENNGTLDMQLSDGTQIVFDNITSAAEISGDIFHI
jgi:Ca2+-binding RTX toxin-like protein